MARPDISMTDAEVAAFLAEGGTLQVATIGPAGWPHVVPMWFAVMDGRVVFRSFSKSQKIVNLRRDPRLTVLLEEGTSYRELRGVSIEGTARLVDDASFVLEIYRETSKRYAYAGDTPVALDDAALEATFGRFAAKNTGVIVEPSRVTSWDHRKLGGSY